MRGGLHRQDVERDACGIGFVADVSGRALHDVLERALAGLAGVGHRGAVAADWMRAWEGALGRFDEALLGPVLDADGSDSAMLDNALELLVRGGRDVRHALTMLVPEAWRDDPELGAGERDFYRYHAGLLEPWDGPAGLVFTDGRVVGATLTATGCGRSGTPCPARSWPAPRRRARCLFPTARACAAGASVRDRCSPSSPAAASRSTGRSAVGSPAPVPMGPGCGPGGGGSAPATPSRRPAAPRAT